MTYELIGTPTSKFYSVKSGADGKKLPKGGSNQAPRDGLKRNIYFRTLYKGSVNTPWDCAWCTLTPQGYKNLYPNNYNKANNAIVDAIREVLDSQQYLADLMESKSTLDLLTVQCRRVLSLTKKIKRAPLGMLQTFKGIGRKKNKPRRVRGRGRRPNKSGEHAYQDIPAWWLEYWFGIAPFVGSLNGVIDVFNNLLEPMPFRGIHRSPPEYVTINATNWREYKFQWSYTGKARVINPNRGMVQRAGLSDLVGALWEVAPWSWAVDYFVNVGDMLSNFDGKFKNIELIETSATKCVKTRGRRRELVFPPYPAVQYDETGEGLQLERGLSLPTSYKPALNFTISVQRLSYLLSAVGLTLKGMK